MTIFNVLPTSRFFLALGLSLYALASHSATLSELYGAVPRPPDDVATALSWVRDGKIVQPELLGFAEILRTERTRIAALNGGATPADAAVAASLDDDPAVQAAARGYADYLNKNQGKDAPEAALGKRKRWLQVAFGNRQLGISEKMTPCASPCSDSASLAANQSYLLQRERELKTEIRSWNALFDDWKKSRRSNVLSAEPLIAATAGGAAAKTPEGRQLMARYQTAMLYEIDLLFSITQLCVLRAEVITRGLDGSESDAITGATKKSK